MDGELLRRRSAGVGLPALEAEVARGGWVELSGVAQRLERRAASQASVAATRVSSATGCTP